MSAQGRSTISVCMIVKNEEELLPRCLASLRNLADEIILVDTGSEDRTPEIAAEFDCRIFHFPWTGDFAAARNESLRQAGGDWIFIIDADEELSPEGTAAIRRLVEDPRMEIVSISVYNKSLATGQVSSFLPSIRLFRRRLGLTYQGIVHNRLSLPDNIQVSRCDIKLYHYGYDLARDRLERKKVRTLELLEKQLRENPADMFANFNMAQLLRGLDGTADDDTCRRIIDHAQVVIDHPQSGSSAGFGYRLMAHIQAALALSSLQMYDEAESYCLDALALKPDYIDAVISLANIYLSAGKTDLAEKHYRQYLDLLDQDDPDKEISDIILHYLDAGHVAWFGLGVIAQMKGDTDEAIIRYRRVLEYGRPYLDTFCRLGRLYIGKGQFHRAEDMFGREIRQNEDSASAHFGIGQALVFQGKPDRALEFLEKSVKLDPDNGSARIFLAQTLINTGQMSKGISLIIETSAMVDDFGVRFECGNLLFAAGRIDDAKSCYEKALELRPDDRDALNNLGNCHFRLEEYETACSIYEQLLAQSSDYVPALRNLGAAHARLGNFDRALVFMARYAEKNPRDTDIFRVIGDLFSSLGYYEKAIACYEKYLKHRPQDNICLLNLAEGYFQLGHHEAAKAGYRRVLEVDPGCQLAQERLDSLVQPQVTS